MLKTKSVLPLLIVILFTLSAFPQSTESVTFKVSVVDKNLNIKSVPKFSLLVRVADKADIAGRRISTSLDGVAELALEPGSYVVISENPMPFESRTFSWEQTFDVLTGQKVEIELSNDNAKITTAVAEQGDKPARRRVNETAGLFKELRNGVVTIEGELGSGTGFIFDKMGLVLTSHHVISETNEIRVRFDKNLAVKARVISSDVERDLAVLQINLAAFPESTVLKLVELNAQDGPIFEGENVFTIGSPLHQEKILTSGIVSKVEARAIISDLSVSAGNAGGPLFNSAGDVAGVATLRVKGKDGSSLAVIARIEEAAELIAKAREIAGAKGKPSSELMPNMPVGTFPVETIKTALSAKDFPTKQYVADVKDYQIKYMTPIYKFYSIHKDRIDSLKIRDKRNKEKGVSADMFRDLSYWSEYAGELTPTVDILALPETSPTAKSMILSAVTNATIGYSTPFDLKYKADFSQMKLMCDGKEVTPLRRNKTEIDRELQNYYKTRKRFTYAGVYTYHYNIFAPGRCGRLELQVFSEEDLENPISTIVQDVVRNRVWTDFSDFRKMQPQLTNNKVQ